MPGGGRPSVGLSTGQSPYMQGSRVYVTIARGTATSCHERMLFLVTRVPPLPSALTMPSHYPTCRRPMGGRPDALEATHAGLMPCPQPWPPVATRQPRRTHRHRAMPAIPSFSSAAVLTCMRGEAVVGESDVLLTFDSATAGDKRANTTVIVTISRTLRRPSIPLIERSVQQPNSCGSTDDAYRVTQDRNAATKRPPGST